MLDTELCMPPSHNGHEPQETSASEELRGAEMNTDTEQHSPESGEERSFVRLQSRSQDSDLPPDPLQVEQPTIRRGTLPGARSVRVQRAGSRRFDRRGETLVATDVATAPRGSMGRVWKTMRRVAVGAPLSTEE